MSAIDHEIASQPECWRRVASLAARHRAALAPPGERIAYIGCGTSWFVAQSIAAAREAAGLGASDGLCASEARFAGRDYDRVVAISRSGTTTEVVDAIRAVAPGTPTVALVAVPGTPVTTACGAAVDIAFADEQSVVQTRFATTALALLRVCLGDDPEPLAKQAEWALACELPDLGAVERLVFLGRGAAAGLANEAALKVRESAGFWAESYPAMEYRHGPITVADEASLVVFLGPSPPGLAAEIAATGAAVLEHPVDPLAMLVVAQRIAVVLARSRGRDPDAPRNLTRSIVLADGGSSSSQSPR